MNLHQPHKYLSARFGYSEHVTFIKGNWPIIEHCYDSAYKNANKDIIEYINKLKNQTIQW